MMYAMPSVWFPETGIIAPLMHPARVLDRTPAACRRWPISLSSACRACFEARACLYSCLPCRLAPLRGSSSLPLPKEKKQLLPSQALGRQHKLLASCVACFAGTRPEEPSMCFWDTLKAGLKPMQRVPDGIHLNPRCLSAVPEACCLPSCPSHKEC